RKDPALWRTLMVKLRSSVESPRWRLFRQFISLPGGLKFLLDLRADILAAQYQGAPDLEPLDDDLKRLFESWFQNGFLFLKEITLDSPYSQIEIIKNRDMVHPMTSLEEVGRRLGRDRRCFALYHRAMPEEPVVFIEVGLTKGLARSIHEIIGQEAGKGNEQSRKDTAVFYSINNTQNGLAGLGLGKVLIFQVVEYLKKTAPQVKNFCTLSPMPGFWRRYLRPVLEGRKDFIMNVEGLQKIFDKRPWALLQEEFVSMGGDKKAAFAEVLLTVFSETRWAENQALSRSLAKPLRRLGYIYLAEEKNRAGRPLDPVANFHLSNGASLTPGHVNFKANCSPKGLERSLGLMVNYVYSQSWLKQIKSSMARLGGLIPDALGRGLTANSKGEDAVG
ncbi:MAG: malonyl-CoA decarboxylase family protein, partial [Thermodesulfobacteriota bacterium]|nr:malonyl-CoA decarboxylase family protein [Thermodesulfobacteriota bacterium]